MPRCIGFGGREGICRAEARHPSSGGRLYWCDECEASRREYISGKLESMVAGFPEKGGQDVP